MIILKKVKKKEILLKGIINITILAKVAQILSSINLTGRYNQTINNIDLDIVKKLGLIRIMKYQRCIGQVEIKLDWLYDKIFVLATL